MNKKYFKYRKEKNDDLFNIVTDHKTLWTIFIIILSYIWIVFFDKVFKDFGLVSQAMPMDTKEFFIIYLISEYITWLTLAFVSLSILLYCLTLLQKILLAQQDIQIDIGFNYLITVIKKLKSIMLWSEKKILNFINDFYFSYSFLIKKNCFPLLHTQEIIKKSNIDKKFYKKFNIEIKYKKITFKFYTLYFTLYLFLLFFTMNSKYNGVVLFTYIINIIYIIYLDNKKKLYNSLIKKSILLLILTISSYFILEYNNIEKSIIWISISISIILILILILKLVKNHTTFLISFGLSDKNILNQNIIKNTVDFIIISFFIVSSFFTGVKPISYLVLDNEVFSLVINVLRTSLPSEKSENYLSSYQKYTGFPKFIKENNSSKVYYVVGYDSDKFYYYDINQSSLNDKNKNNNNNTYIYIYDYIHSNKNIKPNNVKIYQSYREITLFNEKLYKQLDINFDDNISKLKKLCIQKQ